MSYTPVDVFKVYVLNKPLTYKEAALKIGVDRHHLSDHTDSVLAGNSRPSKYMASKLTHLVVEAFTENTFVTIFGPSILYEDLRVREADDACRAAIKAAKNSDDIKRAFSNCVWSLLAPTKALLRLAVLEDKRPDDESADDSEHLPSHRYVAAISLFTIDLMAQAAADRFAELGLCPDTELDLGPDTPDGLDAVGFVGVPDILDIVDCMRTAIRLLIDVEIEIIDFQLRRRDLADAAAYDRDVIRLQLSSVGALAQDLLGYSDSKLKMIGITNADHAREQLRAVRRDTSKCLTNSLHLLKAHPSMRLVRNVAYIGLQEGNATVVEAARDRIAQVLQLKNKDDVWTKPIGELLKPLCEEPSLKHLFNNNRPTVLATASQEVVS